MLVHSLLQNKHILCLQCMSSEDSKQVYKLQLKVQSRSNLPRTENHIVIITTPQDDLESTKGWGGGWVSAGLGPLGPGRRNLPIAAVNAEEEAFSN